MLQLFVCCNVLIEHYFSLSFSTVLIHALSSHLIKQIDICARFGDYSLFFYFLLI